MRTIGNYRSCRGRALLVTAPVTGLALAITALPAPSQDLPLPKLVRITDDLHVIENTNANLDELRAYGGNVVVYVTDEGVLLVDTKFAPMHDFVVEQVRALTDEPIELVVVTHNHADHSGGVAGMQQIGATAIVSAADREHMLRSDAASAPQIGYSGQLELMLGGKEIQLIELRGHTRGDTVAYFPAARVVAAGDLVTTAATIPLLVNYADGGTWSDLGRALDAIGAIDFDYLVGGHGPVITKQAFLELRARIAALTDRFRALNGAGADAEEIAATLREEFGWGGPATRNIPAMMLELR